MKTLTKIILVYCIICGVCSCSSYKSNSNYFELTNTIWDYKDFEKRYDLAFQENKKLVTRDSADTTPNNDEWIQRKRKVKFYFNDRYAKYIGKIYKDSIVGYGKNKDTLWSFKMIRKH
jgi:hypothetical protein